MVTITEGAKDGWGLWWFCWGPVLLLPWGSQERPCWVFSAAALQPHHLTVLFHQPIVRLSSYQTLWERCRWEAAPANRICFSVITLQSVKENSSHIYVWVSKWKWEQAIEHMIPSFFLFKNYHQCCSRPGPVLCGLIHLVALENWPSIGRCGLSTGQQGWALRALNLKSDRVTQMRPPQLLPFTLAGTRATQYGQYWSVMVTNKNVCHWLSKQKDNHWHLNHSGCKSLKHSEARNAQR